MWNGCTTSTLRFGTIPGRLSLQPAATVIGLREGSLLHVSGSRVRLAGTGARIFRAGEPAADWASWAPFC